MTTVDVRILAVSGHDEAIFSPRVRMAGANGYVSKSQEVSEIMRCVEAVLAGYSVYPSGEGVRSACPQNANPDIDRIRRLSDKEIVIMQMLARGMSNKKIGIALSISNKTISTHKARIMAKLEVQTLVELIDLARQCHIAR